MAGVIFKQCDEGQPTLKASNSEEKITLPGRLQLFRGTDANGMYAGDVIGLDSEDVEIPGAANVERLLVPFWENGQHSAIPSIEKQKVIVEEQRQRFADIENYQCRLSDKPRQLRDNLVQRMRADNSGWEEISTCLNPKAFRRNERMSMSATEVKSTFAIWSRRKSGTRGSCGCVSPRSGLRLGRSGLHAHLARVPGPEHHFLINPYGMMFEEITASSLVKVDPRGRS